MHREKNPCFFKKNAFFSRKFRVCCTGRPFFLRVRLKTARKLHGSCPFCCTAAFQAGLREVNVARFAGCGGCTKLMRIKVRREGGGSGAPPPARRLRRSPSRAAAPLRPPAPPPGKMRDKISRGTPRKSAVNGPGPAVSGTVRPLRGWLMFQLTAKKC